HYGARVGVAIALPLAGLATLWTIHCGHDIRNRMCVAAIAVAVLSQAVYQFHFSSVFLQYRSALVRTVQELPAAGLYPLAGDSPRRPPRGGGPGSPGPFSGGCPPPYQTIMRSAAEPAPGPRAIFDPEAWFHPFPCDEAQRRRWRATPPMSATLHAQWVRSIC